MKVLKVFIPGCILVYGSSRSFPCFEREVNDDNDNAFITPSRNTLRIYVMVEVQVGQGPVLASITLNLKVYASQEHG